MTTKTIAAIAATILFCLNLTAQTRLPSYSTEATVVGNYDGDNLTLRFGKDTASRPISCRIVGMDAPERLKRPIINKEQPGASAAKAALAAALPKGSTVMADTSRGRDQYNRLLVRVWWKTGFSADNKPTYSDVALAMIANGFAWYVYDKSVPESVRKVCSSSFDIAKLQQMGIWNPEEYPEKPIDPRKWKKKYGAGIVFKFLHPKKMANAEQPIP